MIMPSKGHMSRKAVRGHRVELSRMRLHHPGRESWPAGLILGGSVFHSSTLAITVLAVTRTQFRGRRSRHRSRGSWYTCRPQTMLSKVPRYMADMPSTRSRGGIFSREMQFTAR